MRKFLERGFDGKPIQSFRPLFQPSMCVLKTKILNNVERNILYLEIYLVDIYLIIIV